MLVLSDISHEPVHQSSSPKPGQLVIPSRPAVPTSNLRKKVHALVALGSVSEIRPPDAIRAAEEAPPPALSFQQAVWDKTRCPGVSKTTTTLLDAIAIIAVRARKEAVAVGVQVHHVPAASRRRGSVTITMASDADVPSATVQHLEAVWVRLMQLADLHTAMRTEASDRAIHAALNALARAIYRHNFAKFFWRLDKYFDAAVEWDWARQAGSGSPGEAALREFLGGLKKVMGIVRWHWNQRGEIADAVDDPAFLPCMDRLLALFFGMDLEGAFDEISEIAAECKGAHTLPRARWRLLIYTTCNQCL